MPPLESRPSPHRWHQIRRLELFPDIRALDHYEQAVLRGALDTLAFLRGIEPLRQLKVTDLQMVHHAMFKEVHPWAGQFRRAGQMAIVAGFPAADPSRIARELELALCQMRELLDRGIAAGNPLAALAALALLHVRFERVHPFQDGNGRTGRAILAVQFEKLFGVLPRFTDQPGYRAAIRASAQRDLAPLINYLGASAGLPRVTEPWPAPFRVNPRFLEEAGTQPTFDDDLAWSRSD